MRLIPTRSRKLIAFPILILLALNSVSTLVTATPTGPTVIPLSGTFQAVNNGPGDQIEPDLDCNLTSYRNDDGQGLSLIHYSAPPANTDHVIPGNGLDTQPDINGNRIAFTEDNPQGGGIVVYDVMSLFRIDIPGGKRSNPAIVDADEKSQLITSANQIRANLGCL